MSLSEDLCDGLPQGRIQIRDSSGFWLTSNLDNCEVCTSLYWFETDIGKICIAEPLKDAMMDLAMSTLD